MTDQHGDPERFERLFNRGLLTRRQFIDGLAAFGLTASSLELLLGSEPPVATAQPLQAHYLVLIVLDAFRPDYMQLAPMPALQALMKAGTAYDRAWVGQLESETPVGHATLSTGAMPKHEGLIGFEWRDPRSRQEALDGWPPGVLAGKLEQDIHASGASSIPQRIKAADPAAKIVALSSEKVYAAGAMGGVAADYILYHRRMGPNKQMLTASAVPGHLPPMDFFNRPNLRDQLPMKHFTDWDYLSTVLAVEAFDAYRPRVLMVNLPGADVYGHPYGGPAAPSIFAQIAAGVDRNIARIVQAYQRAGIYQQTLFVVTADHGMVPNDRSVDGTVTKEAVRRAGGNYFFHTGGTAADIYLHNWWHARAVAGQMVKVPNVAAAYYQHDHQGRWEYLPAPGLKIDAALDAAYQYLLNTFVGPTAPDVVAAFRENTVGELVKNAHGDHGGLNWGAQHIPLIMSGPGVASNNRSQFPARLMDVAPTVLRLLGLPPAPNMDGIVLADALASPLAGDVATQSALSGALTAYQTAIISQSLDNIAEDQKTHTLPPPSLPQRP